MFVVGFGGIGVECVCCFYVLGVCVWGMMWFGEFVVGVDCLVLFDEFVDVVV